MKGLGLSIFATLPCGGFRHHLRREKKGIHRIDESPSRSDWEESRLLGKFQAQFELPNGLIRIAQRRSAMAAEIVLGLLKLLGSMPQFVQGVMDVRMMLVFSVFLSQITARRCALDVIAGILQRNVELFDSGVDGR